MHPKYFVSIFFICFFLHSILFFGQDNRIWASYAGGNNSDIISSIANDANGNTYLAGHTSSPNNIALTGFQNTFGGGTLDAFLIKLDNLGNKIWATYYGGNGDDESYHVNVDNNGNVYLSGRTNSTNNISFNGFQNTFGGGQYDGFLVKFDANGNRLWATYYGDFGFDPCYGSTVDAVGNVYIIGSTQSPNNIAFSGYQNTLSGFQDAYLVKFDANGNRLWATYYGFSSGVTSGVGVSIDPTGNIFISGHTRCLTGMSTPGASQVNFGGIVDAFVAKFDINGNRVWCTYYGGIGEDYGYYVTNDGLGNVYLCGSTNSNNNISFNGHQNGYGGGIVSGDSYLAKFDNNGNRLWATYYGGTGDEISAKLAIDNQNNVFLAGSTQSVNTGNVIAINGFQNTLIGTQNQFLAKFNSNGVRDCATYFGRSAEQYGTVATDNIGFVYIGGQTSSPTNIAFNGFQNVYGGAGDANIVKFTTCCPIKITNQNFTICQGDSITVANNTYNSTGIYNDTIIFTNGCDSVIITNLTVTTTINVNLNPIICSDSSYTLPNGNIVNTSGTYKDTLTSTKGCDSIITIVLTVNSVVTSSTNVSICSNSSYTLPSGLVVNTSGTYSDTLTSSKGCDSIITTIVFVNNTPTASITGVNDTIIIGDSTTLTANGGISYNWYPSSGLNTSTGSNVIASPLITTNYCVIVTDSNGCKDTACYTLYVTKLPCLSPTDFNIPNAFSPNNDGINDEICIQGWDVCMKEFKIIIYNRWGEKVYESIDPNFCWDGKYKNEMNDPQVFVYYIVATSINEDEKFVKRGNITLIR